MKKCLLLLLLPLSLFLVSCNQESLNGEELAPEETALSVNPADLPGNWVSVSSTTPNVKKYAQIGNSSGEGYMIREDGTLQKMAFVSTPSSENKGGCGNNQGVQNNPEHQVLAVGTWSMSAINNQYVLTFTFSDKASSYRILNLNSKSLWLEPKITL